MQVDKNRVLEYRKKMNCGLLEARNATAVRQLLDAALTAKTVNELRQVVIDLIAETFRRHGQYIPTISNKLQEELAAIAYEEASDD